MELQGRTTAGNGSRSDHQQAEWGAPSGPDTGLQESMLRLGLLGREYYPERPGLPDCAYYMRTGICGYGSNCRYNHPRDRSLVGESLRLGGGECPERVGEPACRYYLRTGTCKFGASCKFHHPRNAGGSLSNVMLNTYGYPLRPDEKECSYYLKTGQCKFGINCKFHHPQPAGPSLLAPADSLHPTVRPPSGPSPEQHGGASTSYGVATPPLLQNSYVPGAYSPVLFPSGVVPFPSWSPYSGPLSPALSPGAQPSVGAGTLYGVRQLSSSVMSSFAGPYPPFPSPSGPPVSGQKERIFPERPGQPECQYYLKTGHCKFGSSCKYHHPPDWVALQTNCAFSPLGLPLRPGVQPCKFYLKNGHCKFGATCKFDHPMGTVRYSPSASSLNGMSVAHHVLGSSLEILAPSMPLPELQQQFISGSKMNSHISRVTSTGITSSSVGFIISTSSKNSSSLNVSRGTR